MASAYYLIDSGTSFAYLVSDAFVSFNMAFCGKITALSNSTVTFTCGGNVSRGAALAISHFLEAFDPLTLW
jgi:hypothetical protein